MLPKVRWCSSAPLVLLAVLCIVHSLTAEESFGTLKLATPDHVEGRHSHACGVLGSSLYSFGGRTGRMTWSNKLDSFDLENNRWSTLGEASLPGRSSHSLTPIGKRLFVFGGREGMFDLRNDVISYDTVTGEWDHVAFSEHAPSPRQSHSAAAIGHYIYIYGGKTAAEQLADLWVYNTKTQAWSKPEVCGRMPGPRHGHSSAFVGAKLYIFGGMGPDNSPISTVHVLDLVSHTWDQIESAAPTARAFHTSTVAGREIYLVGGSNAEQETIDIFNIDTAEWRSVSLSTPLKRSGQCISRHDDRLLVFGGQTKSWGVTNFLSELMSVPIPSSSSPFSEFAVRESLDLFSEDQELFIQGKTTAVIEETVLDFVPSAQGINAHEPADIEPVASYWSRFGDISASLVNANQAMLAVQSDLSHKLAELKVLEQSKDAKLKVLEEERSELITRAATIQKLEGEVQAGNTAVANAQTAKQENASLASELAQSVADLKFQLEQAREAAHDHKRSLSLAQEEEKEAQQKCQNSLLAQEQLTEELIKAKQMVEDSDNFAGEWNQRIAEATRDVESKKQSLNVRAERETDLKKLTKSGEDIVRLLEEVLPHIHQDAQMFTELLALIKSSGLLSSEESITDLNNPEALNQFKTEVNVLVMKLREALTKLTPVSELERDATVALERLDSLQTESADFRARHDALVARVSELQSQIVEAGLAVTEANQALEAAKNKAENVSQQWHSAKQDESELQAKLELLTKELAKAEEGIADSHNDEIKAKRDLLKIMSQLDAERALLMSANVDHRNTYAVARAAVENWQRCLNQVTSLYERYTNARVSLELARSNTNTWFLHADLFWRNITDSPECAASPALCTQIARLRADFDKLQKDSNQLSEEIVRLSKYEPMIDELKAQLQTSHSENAGLQNKLAGAQGELADTQLQLLGAKDQVVTLEDTIKDLKIQLGQADQTLVSTIDMYDKQLAAVKSTLSEREAKIQDLESQLTEAIKQHELKINQLQAKHELDVQGIELTANAKIAELREQIEQKMEDIKNLTNENGEMRKQLEHSVEKEQLAEAQNQLKQAVHDRDQAMQSLDQSTARQKNIATEARSLQSQIEKKDKEILELVNEIEATKAEIASLRTESTNTISALEHDLKSQVLEKEEELKQKIQEISNQKEIIMSLENELESLRALKEVVMSLDMQGILDWIAANGRGVPISREYSISPFKVVATVTTCTLFIFGLVMHNTRTIKSFNNNKQHATEDTTRQVLVSPVKPTPSGGASIASSEPPRETTPSRVHAQGQFDPNGTTPPRR